MEFSPFYYYSPWLEVLGQTLRSGVALAMFIAASGVILRGLHRHPRGYARPWRPIAILALLIEVSFLLPVALLLVVSIYMAAAHFGSDAVFALSMSGFISVALA